MKLNTHPAIQWPPAMRRSNFDALPFPLAGIDGTLQAVEPVPNTHPSALQLTVAYEGREYTGTLLIYDPALPRWICEKLAEDCLGKSMAAVGATDLS